MSKPWDFEIKEVYLADLPDFKGIKGFERDKALINITDNSRLGIVSRDYTVISHKLALNTLLQAIREMAKDDPRFQKTKIREDRLIFGKNKSTMKLDIVFPEIIFDLGKTPANVDDIVNFQFSFYNGITGHDPFLVQFNGDRQICKNGVTTKVVIENLKFSHRRIDIPALKETIKNKFSGFTNVIEEWKKLKEKNISSEELKKFFIQAERNSKKYFVSKIHVKRMEKIAPEILEKEGSNLWTVANLATNYTTHDKRVLKSSHAFRRINLINNFIYAECMKLAA